MIRSALFILAQCTWGILQTFVGSIVFLLNIRRKHYLYHGAVITEWGLKSSLSMGLFCFVTKTPFACGCCTAEEVGHRLVVHEYGHSIQSLILGPFYLFAMALPSMLWAGLPPFEKFRLRKNIKYHWLYTERWANHLGEKVTKEDSMRDLH
jgi:Zn-dependent protease